MELIKVTIYTTRPGTEAVTASLFQLSIYETEIEDPFDLETIRNYKDGPIFDYLDEDLLKKDDEEVKVYVYFKNDDEGRRKVQEVKLHMMSLKSKEMEGCFDFKVDLGRLYVKDEIIRSEDYENNWKKNFHPVRIIENLVVKPTWEDYEEKDGELVMEIDPEMAFGTGSHETTRLSMKLLSDVDIKDKTVLDIGTGSGILSIGAALLGAKKVYGIDIDEEAVRVARGNAELNNLSHIIEISRRDFKEGFNIKADIIVANLMADLVVDLCKIIKDQGKDEPPVILSGIIKEKEKEVKDALTNMGYSILKTERERDWTALTVKP